MTQTYLIFGHRGARYGLPVTAVREMVWLPELSPVEELPAHIVGVFNLRGKVVPVMDLGLRFNHPRQPYCLSDRVIVLDQGEAAVGLVANELLDVLAIAQADIAEASSYQGAGGQARFVRGEARLEAGLAMLLDVATLLRGALPEVALSLPSPTGAAGPASPCFGELSPQQLTVLRARSRSLAQVTGAAGQAAQEAFAVIRLDRELFGLGLDVVREFSHLRSVSPLPCCPPHIAGNMNLRGDILTLIDIRPALGMASSAAMSEVAVLRIGELRLGLQATEIVDVAYLTAADIAATPVASERSGKAYCKGVATHAGQAVAILDLEKMLAGRALQVSEKVP